jgi:hypothetical protein
MRGVGRCECGISSDIARGAVKDHALGYVSWSNRCTGHMSHMGVASLVTNCNRSIRETSKKVALVSGWEH